MPNTLLEYMTSKKPILCSEKGPMPEVLGKWDFYFDPENVSSIKNAISNLILQRSIWTNLSLTYSNGFMNLFINGNLVDESSEFEVSIDVDEPIRLGSNTANRSDEFLPGFLDNLIIWDYSLESSEINSFLKGISEKVNP